MKFYEIYRGKWQTKHLQIISICKVPAVVHVNLLYYRHKHSIGEDENMKGTKQNTTNKAVFCFVLIFFLFCLPFISPFWQSDALHCMICLYCKKNHLRNSACPKCQLRVSQRGFQPQARSRMQMLGPGIKHTQALELDLIIIIQQEYVLSIRILRIANEESGEGPWTQNL